MAFCTKCGNETKVEVVLCPKCNASQVDYKYKIVTVEDEKSPWKWLIPSFFIPILGFVLFLSFGYSKPKSTMFALIGTIAGSFAITFFIAFLEILRYGIY